LRSDSGGIGGTGIVGTITGFGSVIVNGLHVEVPPNLPVNSVYGLGPAAGLRVGQVVAIEAESRGGRLTARNIDIRYPVTGAVERIDRAAGEIVVLGQRVKLTGDTRSESGRTGLPVLDGLAVGDPVDVSGLRDGGVIHAGWVRRRRAGGIASLFGPVTAAGAGGVAIGGRRLAFAGGGLPPGLRSGDVVQIIGDSGPGGFRVRRLRQLPAAPFGGRVGALSLEGFVARGRGGRGWRLGGAAFDAGPGAAGLAPGARMVLSGGIGPGGRVVARDLRRVPPGLSRGGGSPGRASPGGKPAGVKPGKSFTGGKPPGPPVNPGAAKKKNKGKSGR
jgi:hypothetical protein